MLHVVTTASRVAASLLVVAMLTVRVFAWRHGVWLGWNAWKHDQQAHKLRVLATSRGGTFARNVRVMLLVDLVAAILGLPIMILFGLCMLLR
jgi:hypothetical protein